MDVMQAQATASAQLGNNERLLWSGGPAPGRAALSAIPASLFGIPFTAFAVFWISMAWMGTSRANTPGPLAFFPLFGVPFVIVGLGTLLSPLWAYLAAASTTYAVTDQRVMIMTGRGAVRSLLRGDIGEISRQEHGDGTGTLSFASRGAMLTPFARNAAMRQTGLVGIPDARTVEQLIRDNLVQRDAA